MLNQDIYVSNAWVLRKCKETLLMQKIMILTIAFIQQNLVKDESRFSIVNNDLKVRIPYLYFSDGVARVIDHMYVIPTTYTLNSIINGDAYTQSLVKQKGSLWITATGVDADGNETGTVQFDLCKDGVYVSDWTKFDLTALGKVVMVVFDMDGTDKGDWGLNTPAYFAYDDVAVQF